MACLVLLCACSASLNEDSASKRSGARITHLEARFIDCFARFPTGDEAAGSGLYGSAPYASLPAVRSYWMPFVIFNAFRLPESTQPMEHKVFENTARQVLATAFEQDLASAFSDYASTFLTSHLGEGDAAARAQALPRTACSSGRLSPLLSVFAEQSSRDTRPTQALGLWNPELFSRSLRHRIWVVPDPRRFKAVPEGLAEHMQAFQTPIARGVAAALAQDIDTQMPNVGATGWAPNRGTIQLLMSEVDAVLRAREPEFTEWRRWPHAQLDRLPTLGHQRALHRLGHRQPELVHDRAVLAARVQSREDTAELYAPWHFLLEAGAPEGGEAIR